MELRKSRQIRDKFGRPLTSLRISVTQKCNLNCFHCHKEGEVPSSQEMNRNEIFRIVELASSFGIKKIKLTGGEPLLRNDLCQIINKISPLVEEISLTTNGVFLKNLAQQLHASGLHRINVSMPSLDEKKFKQITGKPYLSYVKIGIDAAVKHHLNPVKLNMVVFKGLNNHEIPAMIDYAKDHGAILQLIELQPIPRENHEFWNRYYFDLTPLELDFEKQAKTVRYNELHKRKKYFLPKDGSTACVEIIRPIHNSTFCENCTRLRLTSDGKLKPCLMRNDNLVDIISLIRKGQTCNQLDRAFEQVVEAREPYWKVEP